MSSPTTDQSYRPDIDGLRAVAVSLVIAFHAFPSFLSAGFIGVDIFFVISGFLITGIIIKELDNGNFSLATFYVRRTRRIFPSLILVMASCLVAGWYVLRSSEYKALGWQALWGAGFMENLLMKRESGYFDTEAELKPFLHLWSLGIEEQFYVIWPVILIIIFRNKFSLFYSTATIFCLSFIFNIIQTTENSTAAFYSPHTRFWELLIGSFLAQINQTGSKGWPLFVQKIRTTYCSLLKHLLTPNTKATIGFFLIALSLLFADKNKPFPGFQAMLPTFGAFFLIAAGSQAWLNRIILGNKSIAAIGVISYPLYLWHWPLLSFLRIIENGNPLPEHSAVAITLSIILAWITHRFIERHLRFQTCAWITPGLILFLILIGIVGWQIHQFRGIPERMAMYESKPKIEDPGLLFKEISVFPPCAPTELRKNALLHNDIFRCRQTKPQSEPITVALIGDSHAEHLFLGLAKYQFADENLLYVSHTCLPFIGLSGTRECEITSKAVEFIARDQHVHTVILSNRWESRWNDQRNKLLDDPSTEKSSDIFMQSFARTLDRLLTSGKHVIFALDVPTLSFRPEDCQTRPYMLGQQAQTPCAVPRSNVENLQNEYRELSLLVLKNYPSVQVWDPLKLLCNNQWCRASDGDIALYADKHHISVHASKLLGSRFPEGMVWPVKP